MNSSAPPHPHPDIVGSPRSWRSTQQANATAFHVPTTPGEEYAPIPPGTLYASDGGAFNVDPTAPYLGARGVATSMTQDGPSSPVLGRSNSKRFVGGFVSAVKKVMGQQDTSRVQQHSEEGHLIDASHNRERNYDSHPSPVVAFAAHTSSAHGDQTHGTNVSPTASSSHTRHDSLESRTNDDGTTVVDHAVPTAQVANSPVYVEPQLGSDYAKMDSPRHSITSLASYVSRIRRFLHDLNQLPWVADRVTVDYIPGKEKGRRQLRPTSWYGGVAQPGHHTVDLFSDTTSPTSLAAHHATLPTIQYSTQPEVIFRISSPGTQTEGIPYAHVVPASYNFTPTAVPAPQMPRSVPQDRPRTVIQSPRPARRSEPPAQQRRTPQHLPANTPAQSPPTAAFRPYGETFPLGYVPYQQQAAVAEQYNDLSVHGLSHIPRPVVSSTSGTATQPSRPVSSRTQPSRPVSTAPTPRVSRPPSAAGNSHPQTPHTPAAAQYPYPVSTPV